MLRLAIVVLLASGIPAHVAAEIEKNSVPSQSGMRLMWWPKVSPATGWHLDRNASLANGINLVIPDGASFANAETVIYARALYKPREPGTTSVQALIEKAQADFVRGQPGYEIKEAAAAPIADGTALRTFTFHPKSRGNWERVAYGEDGEYYLLFVVSSRTRQGLEGANAAFEAAVKSYTREPAAANAGQ